MSILGGFRKHGRVESKEKIRTDCDSEIMECIKKGLFRFGDSVPQVILYNLKWMSGLGQEDIPDKPEEFEKCLERIFGQGSSFVKKAMIDEINAKFGLTQDCKSLKEAFVTATRAFKRLP
ncbi:MAG: hypothetical protein ACREBS_09545 [Nitrososphaerales archaeon]